MLCKGSALSKSHFLLWKRNVVEPNDVYLNISFECHITLFLLYCLGIGLTRQAYWKFLSCDVNMLHLYSQYTLNLPQITVSRACSHFPTRR